MSDKMYNYTTEEIVGGTKHRAEYHIVIESRANEDVPDDGFIEKYLVGKLASKIMEDLINGFGGRGVSLGDVYRYNQSSASKASEK